MRHRVLTLDSGLPAVPSIVGGKAAGLARLCAMGANVPAGFVIPAATPLDRETMIEVDGRARAIEDASAPGALFAVRSSGVLEDGAMHSFAGMYKTFLNVSANEVGSAIRACRSSATSPRLLSYRGGLKSGDPIPLAVVVQRMLQPDVAGVAFTLNPITLSRVELMIEVVRGVGESLVSGQVTPQAFVLRARDGALIDFIAGDVGDSGEPIMSEDMLRTLWAEARRVEGVFGHPVDLEFAFERTTLYLLQARPVTVTRQAAV